MCALVRNFDGRCITPEFLSGVAVQAQHHKRTVLVGAFDVEEVCFGLILWVLNGRVLFARFDRGQNEDFVTPDDRR